MPLCSKRCSRRLTSMEMTMNNLERDIVFVTSWICAYFLTVGGLIAIANELMH